MLELFIYLLQYGSAAVFGLLMGALLAEGVLLVPYWQQIPAHEFLARHKEFGPRLYKFFAPLTILGTMLPGITAIVTVLVSEHVFLQWPSIVAGLLASGIVGIYFLYFKEANKSFEEATITPEELPDELVRWAWWHWLRVIIGLLGFAAALFAL